MPVPDDAAVLGEVAAALRRGDRDAADGLPLGLQCTARFGDDERLPTRAGPTAAAPSERRGGVPPTGPEDNT